MKTLRFLGWSKPLPELAAPLLLNEGFRYGDGPSVDLSGLLVLLPGRQAMRVLTETMADLLAPLSAGFFPPEFYTPERFLLEGGDLRGIATPLEQIRAWKQVVSDCGKAEFPSLFPVDFPHSSDTIVNNLAAQFRMLKRELSAGGLTIASVSRSGATLDTERWEEIAELERRYTELLFTQKRTDPEDRKIALAESAEPFRRFEKLIVLAMPDLSTLLLKRLAKAAEIMNVELWINAPQKMESMFDGWGRPLPESWADYPLDFGTVSGDPEADDITKHLFKTETAEQLAIAVSSLLSGGSTPELSRKTIAVTEETWFDPLRKELSKLKIKGSGGRTLIVTSPSGEPMRKLRLHDPLSRLRGFMESDDFSALHELLRQEDFLVVLEEQLGIPGEQLLVKLDQFRMEHLPDTLEHAFQSAGPDLIPVFQFFRERKQELESLPPADAVESFVTLLYGKRGGIVSSGIPLEQEMVELRNLLDTIRKSPLFRDDPLNTVLTELLNALGEIRLYREPLEQEFQVGGFLDLPWSRAAELILCGMNDGAIPESVHGSTFLSDTMREKLGLQCDRRRFGRDVLYLESLLRSRGRDHVFFLASRFDTAGKPLKFSRLFFQGSDRDVFDRASILFEPVRFPESPADGKTNGYRFRLAPDFSRADRNADLSISVTQFKEYLQSPFRFFLGNFLGMRENDYDAKELDRAAFGSCCHSALERLGPNPSTDPETVRKRLFEALDAEMRKQYGSPLPVLIAIQNEQMKQRLGWAAEQITKSAREFKGLECEYVLGGEDDGIAFAGARIRGRIDRIEYSSSQHLLRLIDYKTTDSGESPEKDHYHPRSGRFSNLQLPLYRLLILRDAHFRTRHPEIDYNTVRIHCGYLTMPKNVTETAIRIWENMDALLPQAEELVREIISEIRQMKHGIFYEDPGKKIPFDTFQPYLLPDLKSAVPTAQWISPEAKQ